MKKRHQSGNAVVIILIAVALFAALAYTFMNGARQGTGNLTAQQAKIAAQELLNYGQLIQRTVDKFRQRGCSESQFDFSNDIYKRKDGTPMNTPNTNAPADGSCTIFSTTGGQTITPYIVPSYALDYGAVATASTFTPGHGYVAVYPIKGFGTDGPAGTESATELILQFPLLNKTVCMAVNNLVGVENPNNDAPLTIRTGGSGAYSNGSFAASGLWEEPQVVGKAQHCVLHEGLYIFRSVLLDR